MRSRGVITALIVVVTPAGCGDGPASEDDGASSSAVATPVFASSGAETAASADSAAGDQQFPVIVEATASRAGTSWTFEVTVSSPYDTPERYADGWRVLGPDGEVYGEHTLTHDHAGEQPFTRTQEGVEIPDGVAEVTVEGRDLVNGYGGSTVTVQLDSP